MEFHVYSHYIRHNIIKVVLVKKKYVVDFRLTTLK